MKIKSLCSYFAVLTVSEGHPTATAISSSVSFFSIDAHYLENNMEVNSSISDLMREWLTEGKDRDTKKAKGLAPSSNVFQPRPER